MSISYGALAGLIAAVAFLILVLFTLPLIVRATKTMKKVDSNSNYNWNLFLDLAYR